MDAVTPSDVAGSGDDPRSPVPPTTTGSVRSSGGAAAHTTRRRRPCRRGRSRGPRRVADLVGGIAHGSRRTARSSPAAPPRRRTGTGGVRSTAGEPLGQWVGDPGRSAANSVVDLGLSRKSPSCTMPSGSSNERSPLNEAASWTSTIRCMSRLTNVTSTVHRIAAHASTTSPVSSDLATERHDRRLPSSTTPPGVDQSIEPSRRRLATSNSPRRSARDLRRPAIDACRQHDRRRATRQLSGGF